MAPEPPRKSSPVRVPLRTVSPTLGSVEPHEFESRIASASHSFGGTDFPIHRRPQQAQQQGFSHSGVYEYGPSSQFPTHYSGSVPSYSPNTYMRYSTSQPNLPLGSSYPPPQYIPHPIAPYPSQQSYSPFSSSYLQSHPAAPIHPPYASPAGPFPGFHHPHYMNGYTFVLHLMTQ